MSISASGHCKQSGLKSLKELSECSSVSVQTLSNWYKSRKPEYRRRFDLVLKAVLFEKTVENIEMSKRG